MILLYLPCAASKFLKIAQVKPCSSVVARSLRNRKVTGSNPTVGKNFSFCNSRSTCVPISSR